MKKNFLQRKKRVRAKIFATNSRPRLSVFRSSKHIYAQIIDDGKGVTLASFSDMKLKKGADKKNKTEIATLVGEELAEIAKAKKISKVTFDRSGYKYHGRIVSLAEALRKGGLIF